MKLENHLLDIMQGKKSPGFMGGVLQAASHCYHAAVSLRNWGYDKAFFETLKFSFPIISVGNIVAGGTGKTPFVHYLASRLGPAFKTAILTRGYRRRSRGTCLVNEETQVKRCGDEPYFLKQKLPLVHIFVGSNRVFSAHLAGLFDTEVAILDDGMQHRRLYRDFEIGMVHAEDFLSTSYYLPRGMLRDNPKRLAQTDLIVVTGADEEERFDSIKSHIRKFTSAAIVSMEVQVVNPEQLSGKKVAAFCAIAMPDRFIRTIKSLDCDIVMQQNKPDHRAFSILQLEEMVKLAKDKGAECLVCTEKDFVKIPPKFSPSLPLIPVKIGLSPKYDSHHLENLLQKIDEEIHARRI